MEQLPVAFLIGLGIGVVASLIGAALSYWFGLRGNATISRTPLFFLLLIILALSCLGAVVSLLAIPSGTLLHALATGLGVIVGFSATFGLLLGFWLKREAP